MNIVQRVAVSVALVSLVTPVAIADCDGAQLRVNVVQQVGPNQVAPFSTTIMLDNGSSPKTVSGGSYTMWGTVGEGGGMLVSAAYGYTLGTPPSMVASALAVCSGSAWRPSPLMVCFKCPAPQPLHGSVVRGDGTPIASAAVKLNGSSVATTNANGEYDTTLRIGGTQVIEASAAGYGTATSAPFTWNGSGSPYYTPQITAPVVKLPRLGSISGTVIQALTRHGYPDFPVTLTGNGLTMQVRTKADGTFTIADLPSATYTLTWNDTLGSRPSIQVTVTEGQTAPARIIVGRPGLA